MFTSQYESCLKHSCIKRLQSRQSKKPVAALELSSSHGSFASCLFLMYSKGQNSTARSGCQSQFKFSVQLRSNIEQKGPELIAKGDDVQKVEIT